MPAAPAMTVLRTTRVTGLPAVAASCEPALKPNHPNQRMNTPSTTMGIAWPAICRGVPSGVYLPKRGPRNTAPASAAAPPVTCTTVEPAKSLKVAPPMEMSAMKPPPHVQWTTSG